MTESYYITQTRLQKNPFLYKTVAMMKTINPSLHIVQSRATDYWARSNWDKITPGNAILVLETSNWRDEFPWENNIPAAKEIMAFALSLSISQRILRFALSSSHTREADLNQFIETRLLSFSEKNVFNYIVDKLLLNKELKVYQLELVWNLFLSHKITNSTLMQMISSRYPLGKVPDYIFKDLLKYALNNEIVYYDDSPARLRVVYEGLRRKYVVTNDHTTPKVLSEPRPTDTLYSTRTIKAVGSRKGVPLEL